MPPTRPIKTPAAYATTFAVGYADANGDLAVVETGTPLPVSLATAGPIAVQQQPADPPAPLDGTTSASVVVGPFTPTAGLPVMVTISGDWQGEFRIQRSVDSGITRHDLTAAGAPWGVYTSAACEPAWVEREAGAELYFDITIQSGTLAYRIAQ